MKAEVTQHAVRLIDAIGTLQGQNERSCQLRTMTFFILIVKFYNCSHIRMEEFSCYSSYSTEIFQLNISKIRTLAILFIHITCIPSWSSQDH